MLKLCVPSISFCVLLVFSTAAFGEPDEIPRSVFDLPRLQAISLHVQQDAAAAFSKKDYAGAEQLLRAAIDRVPSDFRARYNLACALARLGKTDESLVELAKSVELGFRDQQHIQEDEDLRELRKDDRFKDVLKAAARPPDDSQLKLRPKITPAAPENGQVMVSEKNVAWNPRQEVFHALFKFEDQSEKPIAVGQGKAGDLLRQWSDDGTAAGNLGDVYDNHDSDHSNMNFAAFPQLTRVEFSEEARKRRLHHGLQRWFLYNTVTLGNSSTALTSGTLWRSQGRFALTQPGIPNRLYMHYVNNHLYVYPEHRDHDIGHNRANGQGYGDVFPANTPYLIISQGSSGSDRAFLNAVAATLAAFRPSVKRQLAKSGALMPTVQMVFRMSNKKVASAKDYLTGKAHPTVFESRHLNVEKMVTMAHDMTLKTLPPLVQLKVIEEDQSSVGRDYFDIRSREQLFDTPCAIARVVKSTKYSRRMVVSAIGSKDLNDKPLTFHWKVLRGDVSRIRIRKLNESGSWVELVVPYHERQSVFGDSKLESNRVDIGAFVHNGDHFSAPAFISFFYLDNEKRVYDDQHRILSVDYADPSVRDNYVDPMLDLRKDWIDEYHYAKDGTLTGWTRTRANKKTDYTPDGRVILERDDRGRVLKTAAVRYVAKPNNRGPATLGIQIESGE